LSQFGFKRDKESNASSYLESLILAQNQRWRRA
jgi:hypothetical protein